ncbi:protein of unknown function [Arboricoccus pini]|uniref:YjiS-like domain-containing protein n=1 Tax=Arboricoccus pini TaxID=1963835 RepID=A0A212QRJ2_9PROT|nr:DUF1127 domain-containing protein [Arboricoccus pini]SNB62200.1 protein of unknown function [Arboricoccus pini]
MAAQIVRPSHAATQERGFLASIFGRFTGSFAEYRRFNRTRNELDSLTDRELADIGLNRADIDNVAWRCAHRR